MISGLAALVNVACIVVLTWAALVSPPAELFTLVVIAFNGALLGMNLTLLIRRTGR